MKITVEVTQEDIDNQVREDWTGVQGGCAVFRATARCVGYKPELVDAGVITFHLPDDVYVDAEPIPSIAARIKRLDAGQKVRPFTFDIDIPLPV